MDDDEYPTIQYQSLVHTLIGDKSLDYHALSNAFRTAGSPGTEYLLAKRRMQSRSVPSSELLSNPGQSFVVVAPSDRSDRPYRIRECEDDDGGNAVYASFHDNNVKMEYSDRHPGTSMDSDVEDGVDAAEKYPYFSLNDAGSPITTTAAEHLYSVAFAGPGGIVTELRAAYACQLSARIDEGRKCLNFDCFEYKPTCFDPKSENNEHVPTYREIQRWEDSVMRMPKSRSVWDSDEESINADDDDPELDEKVQPKEGNTFNGKTRLVLAYQAAAGNFLNSRCLRVRIPLVDVVGVRLQAAPSQQRRGGEGDDDVGAVLILEVGSRPKPDSFAARKVYAKYHKENEFALVEDWTPNKVASRSTRYYLHGNLTELKQTAALMTRLCPRIAAMLASGTCSANALRGSTSVEYAAAPNFADPGDVDMEGAKDAGGDGKKASNYKMSVADVDRALVEKKLVEGRGDAQRVNPCLKRAILLGHVKIEDSTTNDTVIHRGSCVHCGSSLCCTIGDALHQSTYGGHDYCDGGEDAGVKCESCADEDECGGGNYITALCRGDPEFDSGKFHNHCTECEDFGTCLRDYREAHCRHCGDHYFQGNSGFPCPSCGGGKSKPLKNMDPPPLLAWDGKPGNAMEVFEAQCARLGEMEGAMMKAMVLGPEAALAAGGSVSDTSQLFSAMVTQMAGQIMDAGGEGGGGENVPEQCRQM